MSGGRFCLGLVQGYRGVEYDGWGIPTSERGRRLSEGVDIIRKCWQGETFSYDGEFWQYSSITPDPPPAHDIPILYGARAPVGLRRAARDRVGILSQGPGMEAPKLYAEECKKLGWGPGDVRHTKKEATACGFNTALRSIFELRMRPDSLLLFISGHVLLGTARGFRSSLLTGKPGEKFRLPHRSHGRHQSHCDQPVGKHENSKQDSHFR